MSLVKGRLSCILLLIFVIKCGSAFKIPAPVFEIFGSGFKVSIEGSPGIEVFTFHGRVNRELKLNEPGELHGDVTEMSSDRRWSYSNPNRQFVIGDVIHYWIYVQYNGLGYRLENQKFTVRDFNTAVQTDITYTDESQPPPPKCELSETRVNGEFVCRGSVVFEDNFDSVDFSKWEPITKFSSDTEDAEFNSYQNRSENYYVRNSMLIIAPTLQTSVEGFNDRRMKTGLLDFGRSCTADLPYSKPRDCKREAKSGYILPPVVSAKLRTRKKMRFRYGEVTIRAKVPIGDWLFPELLLLPGDKVYESESYTAGYSSGEIRIAFVRGNDRLINGTEDIDGTQLTGGLILAPNQVHRHKWTRTKTSVTHWGNGFHNYTVRWTPSSISFAVDGSIYANFRDAFCLNADLCADIPHAANWRKGLDLAPFDQDFYIALGVGVGGLGDFPDGILNGRQRTEKPWDNTDPQAERSFFEDQANWFATWKEDAVLQVDHVKVMAL